MLSLIEISGFKSLAGTKIMPAQLEVFVGPNGSGKTTLFTWMKFIKTSLLNEIPPEIIHGQRGQALFSNIDETVSTTINLRSPENKTSDYHFTLRGPIGAPFVIQETFSYSKPNGSATDQLLHSDGNIFSFFVDGKNESEVKKPNQLALQLVATHRHHELLLAKSEILLWGFYCGHCVNDNHIRRPYYVEQDPFLNGDCGNLSSVLHYFMTEHPQVFNEIQFHLKSLVPGFSHLTVKARGGPGEVMAFWREQGVEQDLSLADLSDGILRLLCWMVLFLHPKPPTLICIDEPDLGVHPRTLPLLAGLIKKASTRTQIFVTTHNSYFLSQFDLENITVFRKEDGATKAHKPKDSKTLVEMLEEFGQGEIAALHISEELELL